MSDAPRLAHDPRMQMEHHQPAGGSAVGIKTIEPLAPQQVDLIDRAAAVQVDVVVIEIGMDAERVELPGFGGHLVGLLVVAPVAHIADTFRRQEVWGVQRLLEIRAGPANRPFARSLFDRLDRVADVRPFLVLGHTDMDDAPPREAVRDELGAALLAFLDQEWVVVGNGLVERQGRGDAVFVEHCEDAKDPDPIAVLVVAVAADVRKVRLVSGPYPLRATHWAHRQRGAFRHLPIPMLEVDDDDERDAGALGPSENWARNDRRPRIELLVHPIGALCGHRSLRLLRRFAPSDW